MKVSGVICDVCKEEPVDPNKPGELRLHGYCNAGEPDEIDTFESKEICPRCIRTLFETIERMEPNVQPGSSQLLKRIRR
jgi:hypothetical protein